MVRYSIIIPLFNCESYISKCLDSLINQDFPKNNYEIIVVNDGSTDGSKKIVEEIKKRNDNIVIINKKNGGLSSARNAGLSVAKGEYIIFIDADDYVESSLLSEIDKENNDSDLVICGYYIDEYINNKKTSSKINIFNGENLLDSLSKKNVLDFLSLMSFAWNKAYKKSVIDNFSISFEEGTSLIEDILFNELFIKKCDKIDIVNIPLIHYIQRNNSSSLSKVKYKNLDELLLRSFKKRISVLEHLNADNITLYKTIIFEFMIIYFLNKDSNNIIIRINKVEKFIKELQSDVDFNYIKNKFIRVCTKYSFSWLMVIVYDIKNFRMWFK